MINPHDKLNQKLQEILKELVFEMNMDDKVHLGNLFSLRDYFSLELLGGTIEQYKELTNLFGHMPNITLMQASFFINGFNQLSPNQLGMTKDEYIVLLEANNKISKSWNEIVLPIKTKLMEEIQAEFQQEMETKERKELIMSATKGVRLQKSSKYKN